MVNIMVIPGLDTQIYPNFDRIGALCIFMAQGFSNLSVGEGPVGALGSHASQMAISPTANNSVEKLLTFFNTHFMKVTYIHTDTMTETLPRGAMLLTAPGP